MIFIITNTQQKFQGHGDIEIDAPRTCLFWSVHISTAIVPILNFLSHLYLQECYTMTLSFAQGGGGKVLENLYI